jgi:hypothetical protein
VSVLQNGTGAQSEPHAHWPPVVFGAHAPATQEPLVQSVSKTHTPGAQFA